MFPQLREQLGSALDLVVEFSTLGEYRLGADGAVWPTSALAPAPERAPQLGGAGDHPLAAQAAVRRIVAGGAAGKVPVATPAARRLAEAAASPPRRASEPSALARRSSSPACRGERRHRLSEQPARRPKSRAGAPAVPGQLCLAV
jgi:hypothetical protein